MKIALLNSFYYPYVVGGAEASLRVLATSLVQHGHQVKVVCLAPSSVGESAVIEGVEVERLPNQNVYWHGAGVRETLGKRVLFNSIDALGGGATVGPLENILEDWRPDVVGVHNVKGMGHAVWGVLSRLRIPFLQVLHDHYFVCPSATMFRDRKRCARQCRRCQIVRWPLRRAEKSVKSIVAVSDYLLQKHRELGAFSEASHAEVIYNARPKIEPLEPLVHTGFDQPHSVGFIGKLAIEKGIEIFLEAAQQESRVSPGLSRFVVAGTGDPGYEAVLRERFSSEHIEFLGQQDPGVFYAKVDVVVIPSLWPEPLSGVSYESAGRGVPVISTTNGGQREVISDGVNGWLFDGSVLGLRNALERSRGESLTPARVVSSVSHFFDTDRLVSEYIAAYQATIAAGAGVR